MLKIYHKTIKDNAFQKLEDFVANTWIYVFDPSEEEVEKLVQECQLNKVLINDALDPFEVPRVETEENTTYVFTRAPYEEKGIISTLPILIAVSENHIITVAKKNFNFLDQFLEDQAEFTTTQRVKFFIQLFSELNCDYNNSLAEISRRVRSASVSFKKITTQDIVQFVDFERTVNDFLAALIPTNAMLHNLLSGKHLQLYEKDIGLIEDLFLNNKQLVDMCDSTLKNIVNIRDAYSTIITQDTNRIIKLLTSLTIILTIPTIISSVYGMNVRLPFSGSPLAFWGVIVLTALISYILALIFAKKNWL